MKFIKLYENFDGGNSKLPSYDNIVRITNGVADDIELCISGWKKSVGTLERCIEEITNQLWMLGSDHNVEVNEQAFQTIFRDIGLNNYTAHFVKPFDIITSITSSNIADGLIKTVNKETSLNDFSKHAFIILFDTKNKKMIGGYNQNGLPLSMYIIYLILLFLKNFGTKIEELNLNKLLGFTSQDVISDISSLAGKNYKILKNDKTNMSDNSELSESEKSEITNILPKRLNKAIDEINIKKLEDDYFLLEILFARKPTDDEIIIEILCDEITGLIECIEDLKTIFKEHENHQLTSLKNANKEASKIEEPKKEEPKKELNISNVGGQKVLYAPPRMTGKELRELKGRPTKNKKKR